MNSKSHWLTLSETIHRIAKHCLCSLFLCTERFLILKRCCVKDQKMIHHLPSAVFLTNQSWHAMVNIKKIHPKCIENCDVCSINSTHLNQCSLWNECTVVTKCISWEKAVWSASKDQLEPVENLLQITHVWNKSQSALVKARKITCEAAGVITWEKSMW